MAGAILERILTARTVEDEHGNVLPCEAIFRLIKVSAFPPA